MLASFRGARCAWLAGVVAMLIGTGALTPTQALAEDTYEAQRLSGYLEREGLRLSADPEGKTIAYVRFARREVLEGDDLVVPIVLPSFAPTWPNRFHWLTEQSTIEQELLLREGGAFHSELAEESMRNLRGLGIFALVRVVAVQTDDPAQVGVIVYTRDLWSLRLEQQFSGVAGDFAVGAQVVERNFLGRNKALAGRFFLDTFTYSFGQTYLDPRFLSQRLRLQESFDLILNRETNRVEGSAGLISFGRPYYDLAQRFRFDVLASYADYVYRDQSAGEIAGFDVQSGPSFGDSCTVGSADCVKRVWHDSRFAIEGAVSHRRGVGYKQTFSAGAGIRNRSVEANAETDLEPDQEAVFAEYVLPEVRREVYPFVGYELELPTYAVFTNLATFGQTETVRTGPHCDARFALPLAALGSTRNELLSQGAVGYVLAANDALVDALADGSARLDGGAVVDQHVFLRLRAATPSFDALVGRLVASAVLDARRNDTQNTLVALGGDNGLRGYATQAFYTYGGSRWVANLEYRTKPLLLQSIHLGLVAFYDVGAVYTALDDATTRSDVGLGLRVLFPHFNRYVFRVDGGVPLGEDGFAVVVSYSSEQAVLLTEGEDELSATALLPR